MIRTAESDDLPAILALYPRAFAEEDLRPVVEALAKLPDGVLSLVEQADGGLAGHVMFTTCAAGQGGPAVGLLAPLCVAPERQRQGIGGQLVREGFARLAADGVAYVLVLGDPDYYGRFGFLQERRIGTPYELPPEWSPGWQGQSLIEGFIPPVSTLDVPAPWRQPSLWLP